LYHAFTNIDARSDF